jgi:hypothetical protein
MSLGWALVFCVQFIQNDKRLAQGCVESGGKFLRSQVGVFFEEGLAGVRLMRGVHDVGVGGFDEDKPQALFLVVFQ